MPFVMMNTSHKGKKMLMSRALYQKKDTNKLKVAHLVFIFSICLCIHKNVFLQCSSKLFCQHTIEFLQNAEKVHIYAKIH